MLKMDNTKAKTERYWFECNCSSTWHKYGIQEVVTSRTDTMVRVFLRNSSPTLSFLWHKPHFETHTHMHLHPGMTVRQHWNTQWNPWPKN